MEFICFPLALVWFADGEKTIILQSNKTCEKIITSAGEKEGRKGKKNNSITEQGKINDKEGENAVGGGKGKRYLSSDEYSL